MKVKIFLSYAHSDQAAKAKFLNLLNEYLKIAKDIEFEVWQDLEILPGQKWDAEIRRALDSCDVGILLVSPAFLGRDYIVKIELPQLLAQGVIPVALEAIRFDGSMNLAGLEARQIFRDAKGRAFGQLANGREQRQFVNELFGKIVEIVKAAK